MYKKNRAVQIVWRCAKCHRSHNDMICGKLKCNGFLHTYKIECDKCRKINLIKFHTTVEREWG